MRNKPNVDTYDPKRFPDYVPEDQRHPNIPEPTETESQEDGNESSEPTETESQEGPGASDPSENPIPLSN